MLVSLICSVRADAGGAAAAHFRAQGVVGDSNAALTAVRVATGVEQEFELGLADRIYKAVKNTRSYIAQLQMLSDALNCARPWQCLPAAEALQIRRSVCTTSLHDRLRNRSLAKLDGPRSPAWLALAFWQRLVVNG